MTLKRKSFDRSLDRFGDDAPCSTVTPGFPYQCTQARGSVLSHPTLGRSKSKTGFGRYDTEGSVLFQMGLEHPKSRHRQLSVFVRQFQEFVHDERVFELPLGYSERLHTKLEAEIRAIAPAPSGSEEKDSMEKKANLKEPDEPSGE